MAAAVPLHLICQCGMRTNAWLATLVMVGILDLLHLGCDAGAMGVHRALKRDDA